MELFSESFWPGHPLGRPILGTRASVSRFERGHLAAYFDRVYRPDNILIAAAGHLDHGALRALVERHFAGLERRGGAPARVPGVRAPRTECLTVARSKKQLEQVHICLGAAPEVVRLTLEEIRRLKGELLPEAELRRAKDHIQGGLLLSLEGSNARMNHMARQELVYGRQHSTLELTRAIEAVSAEDVRRVAAAIFDGRLAASVLGNLKGWRPRTRELTV